MTIHQPIMAVPYSYDLRCKVLAAIDRAMRKSHASQLFQISRNTLDLWLARRATTGDVRVLSLDMLPVLKQRGF